MATLIKDRRIVADRWRLLERGAGGEPPEVPSGDVVVPLRVWLEHREELIERSGGLGVWLDSDEAPEAVAAADVHRLALIAVNFPKFGDGRGYSIARLLRERFGYRGELRAIGDVLHDHLYFMEQCGFDAFALRDDQDARAALSAFATFSDAYQTSVLRPLPLFRRRLAAPGS